ncbi:MAG: TIGR00266 family protein [Acinetobacter towneri]|uniref:TIGR00266 family protein n=1 Tax=Acinetobacter TaxID=469 RepID=UPI000CEC1075|nr:MULTISPECIES: TIGR00266 family protein [Acinetobacter]MCK4083630.1 TIGR00266 family protein [Acinetobacter radioresistens]MDD4852818.1 TIGR00266 family protein [Acinetobacter towneri]
MSDFQIVGENEPMLLVSMKKGEKIFCESDSMVMMESNLTIDGKLRGGFFQSMMRKFTNGESLFQQEIKAERGDGDCLLSPNIDGCLQILDVGPQQYILSDESFLAATENVEITAKVQTNIGGALFGGTGGFVVMQTKGQGKVCVSGSGSLMIMDITPEQGEVTIDNGHVVCWDQSLNYSISVPNSNSGGILGNVFNSLTSGEMMVLKFRGNGKVVINSRNRGNYIKWLGSALGVTRQN